MPIPITFTLDLEDHRADRSGPPRYVRNTRALLDWLGERGVRGSVFVVGEVAAREPDLIRAIARDGHELAYHSSQHRPLIGEYAQRFRAETRDDCARLADLGGRAIAGYRAPSFSLTARTTWVVDELSELGFSYSSSALPASNPLHGFPGVPRTPFRWPQGILELPVPLAGFARWQLPYLGGIYLRYLPRRLTRLLHSLQNEAVCAWSYCHPYDFDTEEAYTRFHSAPTWMNLLLSYNRRATFSKLANVLAAGVAPPFAERLASGEFDAAPIFRP
jgi:polysaccharide deacetylase family protein (PEP-CTERM system associated)